MIFKRGGAPKELVAAIEGSGSDEEKGATRVDATTVGDLKSSEKEKDKAAAKLEASSDVFTWRDVSYDVQIKNDTRRLLNDVSGYVAPGKMTARAFPPFPPSLSVRR